MATSFLRSSLKNLFSSGLEISPAKPSNLPSLAISVAVRMKACMATRASEPPTLIRRTPIAARSLDREAERAAVEKIHRLRRHRLHHRLDLLARFDARRIEAIGAGRRIGLEPADHVVEIGHAANEIFGARR